MDEKENQALVKANDDYIKQQVPGILQDRTGIEKAKELRNQELFFRAINR
jgi:hypothetical protein